MTGMRVLRHLLPALKLLAIATVTLGLAYPLLVTVAGMAFPTQSGGSVVRLHGHVVGSSLLGQVDAGAQWFQPRPSTSDYSGAASGGTNLAESSATELADVAARAASLRAANPLAVGPVPADALTASASGLDPDISPAYAAWQAPRVAIARGIPLARVQALIAAHTQHAVLGFIGQDRVNVTELNLALAQLPGSNN